MLLLKLKFLGYYNWHNRKKPWSVQTAVQKHCPSCLNCKRDEFPHRMDLHGDVSVRHETEFECKERRTRR